MENALNKYKEKLEAYDKLTSSPEYLEIISTMPFEFLNAIQLCEKLVLYQNLQKKPHMYFSNRDEAVVFYNNLISFRKRTSKLLEDATYMAEIGRLAQEINSFCTCPYLGPTYFVLPNYEVINIAKKCLTEIPQYPRLCTKEFRWNYIESIILSLSIEDLKWMAKAGIIKNEDIDHISLIEKTNAYQDKIKELCEHFHREIPPEQSYTIKLKGVSFPNKDGSSRQEILKELHEYMKVNPSPQLTTRTYIYTPEIGSPEPALAILYNGHEIGNVGKDIIAEIDAKFNHPQYTAELVDVYGGENNKCFGCKIKLGVIAPELTKEINGKTESELQQSK